MEKLPEICDMLRYWQESWLKTDRMSPYGILVDMELTQYNISTYDIKVAIGKILSKKKEEITPDEFALVEFSEKVRYLKEQALTERVSASPVGQIFLLKSQYGYKDQAIDIKLTPVELIPEFGM